MCTALFGSTQRCVVSALLFVTNGSQVHHPFRDRLAGAGEKS